MKNKIKEEYRNNGEKTKWKGIQRQVKKGFSAMALFFPWQENVAAEIPENMNMSLRIITTTAGQYSSEASNVSAPNPTGK